MNHLPRLQALVLALGPLLSAPALAGSSASADYSTSTEVFDTGGAAVSSASYAGDGSLGAIGRLAIQGLYTAPGGFPGQLYELTNVLEVSAPFSVVGESAALALSVRVLCSDATLLTLAPTDVVWSATGPLSISPAGFATGGSVYQDTPASATATKGAASGSLALTVQDTLPDNFDDYAGDGLPDSWQFTFFGLHNLAAAPAADPDRDGQDNRFEYLAKTSPADPNSRLQLSIGLVPGKDRWRRITLSPYHSKRTYTLSANVDLTAPKGWALVTPLDQGVSGAEYYFIDEITDEAGKFYRVEIKE